MNFFFSNRIQKIIASVLLLTTIFMFVLWPRHEAKAIVFTFDLMTFALQTVDAIATTMNTAKEFGLDTIAWSAVKQAINMLTFSIVQWIQTGQFGVPLIETSFLFGSSIKADQAARFFLTQLTGLDFCKHFPAWSGRQSMHIKFNLTASLQCNFQADWNKFLKGEDVSIRSLLQSANPSNNFWTNAVSIQGAKLDREAEAITARVNEVMAGKGFLSKRDQNKQRIQTPGEFISGHVKNALKKQFEDSSHADELGEAIGYAVGSIIDALLQRGLELIQ